MTQEDTSEENVQALRALVKSTLLPPQAHEDIVFVDCHHDPATQKEVVLWDDVVLAFNDALHVRHKAKVIPFLKGADFRVLGPRRIAAIPGAVLDVMVKGNPTQEVISPPKQSQEQETTPQKTPQDATRKDDTTNTISDHGPQYGLEEVAFATLTTIENPAVVLSASRAPQTDSADDEDKGKIFDDSTESELKSAIRGPELNVDDLDQTRANAELGDVTAQVRLGDTYLEGRGVPQDYQLAMEWFLKAAEQSDPSGERNVGHIHCMGHGVPQDYKIGMEWFLKAAKQGDAQAQCNIGNMYNKGQGVPRDYTHAAEWYRKAAEQGNPNAQGALGKLYQKGDGVTLDYTKAMEWFLKASRQGSDQAQADIGFLYYFGQGVPKDFAASVKWCLQAAEQHNSEAQRRLGHMHEYGQGVPQNYSKAMEWYRKAADQGDGRASNNVGQLYHRGLAIPKDLSKALEWYNNAIAQGYSDARKNRDLANRERR